VGRPKSRLAAAMSTMRTVRTVHTMRTVQAMHAVHTMHRLLAADGASTGHRGTPSTVWRLSLSALLIDSRDIDVYTAVQNDVESLSHLSLFK
jgi:hypothetical protein